MAEDVIADFMIVADDLSKAAALGLSFKRTDPFSVRKLKNKTSCCYTQYLIG